MNDDTVPVARAAVITAGVVENVIIIEVPQGDGNDFTLEGSEIVLLAEGSEVDLGWLWDGEEFQAPVIEE